MHMLTSSQTLNLNALLLVLERKKLLSHLFKSVNYEYPWATKIVHYDS